MEILEISRFFLIGVLGENIVFENKIVLEEQNGINSVKNIGLVFFQGEYVIDKDNSVKQIFKLVDKNVFVVKGFVFFFELRGSNLQEGFIGENDSLEK